MSFTISSYNTRGFPKDGKSLLLRPDIVTVLESSDILCVQETWFTKQDLSCLNSLHENYHGFGVATRDLRDGLLVGRVPGGVAFMWKKSLDSCTKPLVFNHNWCIGLDVSINGKSFILLNVYLPYQSTENEDKYMDCLAAISSCVNELQTTCFAIMGDFNANLMSTGHSLFGKHLVNFCNDNDYIISSKSLLPPDSYTYVCEARGTHSWLDHVVSSEDFNQSVNHMSIGYDITDDDHIPFFVSMDIENIPLVTDSTNDYTPRLKWEKSTREDQAKYCQQTEHLLQGLVLPEALFCRSTVCTDTSHVGAITSFYDNIVKCLKGASDKTIPVSKPQKNKIKPGWTDYVSDLYTSYRSARRNWALAGKPRRGPTYEIYKSAKARSKYAIRYIKNHEKDLRTQAIAKKKSSKNPREFWKEIKRENNSKTPLPCSIDGVSGEQNILRLWREHFQTLFNCLEREDINLSHGESHDISVTVQEVASAIKDLDLNKTCGLDGVYAEHIIYASKCLTTLLSLCFSSCFYHGVLPDSLISVVLVPIIKDKSGKISSKDNYRPIALASVMSKVLEIIILKRSSEYLTTNYNQFGFKKNLGTDHCIYLLKEMISSYKAHNGSLFICFLDASKAFDRVNHNILFEKLIQRGLPYYIVRLLVFWYVNQTMCVRWGGAFSEPFYVSNGVRQGGILSPFLFNLYVDDLSDNLNKCQVGCYIGDKLVNHLMYADDIALCSPSSLGLSRLLKICEDFGVRHDVKYNAKKSFIMEIRSARLKSADLPVFYLNNAALSVTKSTKYLGHIFMDNLSDDLDIGRQCRQIYAQGNVILRKFGRCSIDVKVQLFRSYCTPMYTAQLWWSYSKRVLNKLFIAYHNVLKMMCGLSKFERTQALCANINVPHCSAVIRNLISKFMDRFNQSDNVLIRAFCSSDLYYNSLIKAHWYSLLHIV